MNVRQPIASVHWAESKFTTPRNNGRSVNQEGKHEIHMIINFRQVNIAICHHLQPSLNARSCICEGGGVRSTVGHSVATMDYLYEIIKVFRTCSTRLFLCRPIQTSVVEHFFSSLLLLSDILVYFFRSLDGRCKT